MSFIEIFLETVQFPLLLLWFFVRLFVWLYLKAY